MHNVWTKVQYPKFFHYHMITSSLWEIMMTSFHDSLLNVILLVCVPQWRMKVGQKWGSIEIRLQSGRVLCVLQNCCICSRSGYSDSWPRLSWRSYCSRCCCSVHFSPVARWWRTSGEPLFRPFFPVPDMTRLCSEQWDACRHMAPRSLHRVSSSRPALAAPLILRPYEEFMCVRRAHPKVSVKDNGRAHKSHRRPILIFSSTVLMKGQFSENHKLFVQSYRLSSANFFLGLQIAIAMFWLYHVSPWIEKHPYIIAGINENILRICVNNQCGEI